MYHALLFLHVLAAFSLATAALIYSAFVLGSPVNSTTRLIAEILWGVGGLGVLAFGVWLAFNRPEYEIYNGWIISALVLWVLMMGSGARASQGVKPAGDDSALAVERRAAFAHWMRIVWFTALLVVMVWKPGA